jgi:uncharacterized protein YjiK
MKNLLIILFFPVFIYPVFSADSTNSIIYQYFTENKKGVKSQKISKKLREISGLTTAPDGRLFAHDDEKAIIFQLDSRSGKVIKKFQIGKKKPIRGDFEGICYTSTDLFLVNSAGSIFQFPEGEDGDEVEYTKHNTWLNNEYDVEGLCFDPKANALLLVCKGYAGPDYQQMRAIYSFDLDSMRLQKSPRYLISIPEVIQKTPNTFNRKLAEFFLLLDPKNFAPSGIELHPLNGNIFILSARSRMLIEMDATGRILGVVELKASQHPQPEGITFLPDFTMIISDEGVESRATITLYSLEK